MTPSSPAPSKRSSHSARDRADRGSWASGGAAARRRRAPARAARGARSAARRARRGRRSPAGRTRRTTAGDSFASLATREAAGCRRSWSASKSNPCGVAITISPSITHPSGSAGEKQVVQLREVAIQRPQVAALDEDVVAAAIDDGAKAVPLGLVEQIAARRQRVGQLGQHRLDRRRNGKGRGLRHCGRSLFCPATRASTFIRKIPYPTPAASLLRAD